MSATIRRPDQGDIDWMDAGFRTGMGWPKPPGYFMGRLEEVAAGEITLLVADRRSQYLGHAFVRWQSHYPGFSERQIPEIQDLNVIAPARRQGVASALLDEAERVVGERSSFAGIGVGLYAAYGPAQRLYVERRYVPDGAGIVHKNVPVAPGSPVYVDDDLVLHLIKQLHSDLGDRSSYRST